MREIYSGEIEVIDREGFFFDGRIDKLDYDFIFY